MPVVEKTNGGKVHIRSLGRAFEAGDREEVSDELAAYLCEERGDFEVLETNDVEFTEVDDDSGGQEDEPPDVDEWHDWNEDDWLELDYQQRADDVRAGRVDDHLDEIEDVETSTNVVDAVALRKQDLEE